MPQPSEDPSLARGACLCGGVRFSAALPSLWAAHCHCTLCRSAHGAAFVTWFGVDAAQATLDADRDDRGQPLLRWHASTPGAERGFCGRCGSPLFFRSTRWPGELHIALAHLHGALDRSPQAHVFWDTHVGWAATDPDDGLPRKSSPE